MSKTMLPPGFRVEICGAIGCGKSTLAEGLGKAGAESLLEKVDTHPYLTAFYAEPHKYAFEKNMFFLLDYIHQRKMYAAQDKTLALDHGVVINMVFHILDQAKMTPEENMALKEMTTHLLSQVDATTSLLVYLRCPTAEILRRIAKRGRPFEAGISAAFLDTMVTCIERLLAFIPAQNLLIIDCDQYDVVDNPADEAAVIQLIAAKLNALKAANARQ